MAFYQFARSLCRLYLKIFRGFKVEGIEKVPPTGPVILAANHTSYMDPVALGCALERPIRFLAKEELFHIPLLSPLIKSLGAFPVKRGTGDRGALRTSLEILSQGHCFGIFPEGQRNRTKQPLLPFKPGAAMLAAKSGAVVVPVALLGTKGWFGRITVRIGDPLRFPQTEGSRPSKEELENFSQSLYQAIGQLLKA